MIGRVVISVAGRDKGEYMVVVGLKDGRFLLANGKERRLDNPKPKILKHIILTDYRLQTEQYSSNRSLKKALYKISLNTVTAKEETLCQKRI